MKVNTKTVTFKVSKLNPELESGIIGLMSLIKFQVERRLNQGECEFEAMKDYLFKKVDNITSELGWVFNPCSIYVCSRPRTIIDGVLSQSVEVGIENDNDQSEICSIRIEYTYEQERVE